jgi:prephenate dehydrogenase
MRFKQITIIGVGLIGGSFALAARRAGIAERIAGWGGRKSLEAAGARGVIDAVDSAFEEGRVSDADFIYLAAPVGAILDFFQARGKLVRPGAIVTDAGSAKREICRAARSGLAGEAHFIGGHPMAGSHKTGVEFATADLFREAAYAIVADGDSSESNPSYRNALESVIEVVRAIGARPVLISAEDHDRAVARISHAPQILSTALAVAAAKRGGETTLELAGSGFADMTRLAESSWSVWEDICRANADEIAAALGEVMAEVEAARLAIEGGDFAAARDLFAAANQFTRLLSEKKRGRER